MPERVLGRGWTAPFFLVRRFKLKHYRQVTIFEYLAQLLLQQAQAQQQDRPALAGSFLVAG